MVARLLIGLAIALSSGCLKELPAFSCSEDSQCGAGGTCETNGLCSFSDATCASGRRFGAEQGEQAFGHHLAIEPPGQPLLLP